MSSNTRTWWRARTSGNRWEIQVDAATGSILGVAYRRSDLIESLHDGSWFHSLAKLGIFLPVGVVLLLLWLTGLFLFVLPYLVRARRRRRAASLGHIGVERKVA